MSEVRSYLDGRVTLFCGDCIEAMRDLPENSVDSCVTDPPYHLTSIVKRFGKAGSAPAQYGKDGAFARASSGFMFQKWDGGDIAFKPETWAEVLRVLKPGAYVVAFSSSRTFHHMAVAIEAAGFITHPLIGWITGQGFPKAHRVEVEGWEGWRYGTQSLKPAIEPIYVGQKPFSEKTGTANVLRWGTGALNIDKCRVETGKSDDARRARNNSASIGFGGSDVAFTSGGSALGRWPANVLHDGSDEVVSAFPESNGSIGSTAGSGVSDIYGEFERKSRGAPIGFGDSGSAARFFYTAKADADDRLGSKHPTVKPLDLMQYLVRLVTPRGGTVLDPFAGTGTTGEAAWREGCKAILIEREAEYQADIARRMSLAMAGPGERSRAAARPRPKDPYFEDFFGSAA